MQAPRNRSSPQPTSSWATTWVTEKGSFVMRKKMLASIVAASLLPLFLVVRPPLAYAANGEQKFKYSKDFKQELERRLVTVRTARKEKTDISYGVIVADGLVASSMYGKIKEVNPISLRYEGAPKCYPLDLADGKIGNDLSDPDFWSQGRERYLPGELPPGELVWFSQFRYKNEGIELLVFAEKVRIVRRGEAQFPEKFCAELTFVPPLDQGEKLTASDVPSVLEYIGEFIEVFPDKEKAEAFAAQRYMAPGRSTPDTDP